MIAFIYSFKLAEELLSLGVDLLVLEGMGRAIHTNLYTKFKCECLKVIL
jgi:type II pantothenate kinase